MLCGTRLAADCGHGQAACKFRQWPPDSHWKRSSERLLHSETRRRCNSYNLASAAGGFMGQSGSNVLVTCS